VKITPLKIEGAYEFTPVQHRDPRGVFMEMFRDDILAGAVGHPFTPAQANKSISARGVVRGLHFADVPPGQAKYVTCVRGALLDVVVDIRIGSPTFGQWEGRVLDDVDHRSLYLPEGVGHGFCALSDDTTISYLCSIRYNPAAEHTINAFDPEIGIDWRVDEPVLSDRDAAAPTLAEASSAGLLPSYEGCREYTRSLRTG
jgi:dTDP-4-dehydrorhamnose 3,5-epimerase